MKALVQKLSLEADASFVARTYQTPQFETPWHQHIEYELMVIREGSGSLFVGDHIGEYQIDDVYFLGKNLPHWFRKQEAGMIGSSMVVHFREDFLGEAFFALPEMGHISQLLTQSAKGLRLMGTLALNIGNRLKEMEVKGRFEQWLDLMQSLHQMGNSDEYELLNQLDIINYSAEDQSQINLVFEYSMQHFQRKIRLEEVADLTNRSVSAFCHYFKRSTKKSYVQFLTEVRITHVCKLLAVTQKSISEICYESGFNNWANFSKHFKNLRNMSPSEYRRQKHRQRFT